MPIFGAPGGQRAGVAAGASSADAGRERDDERRAVEFSCVIVAFLPRSRSLLRHRSGSRRSGRAAAFWYTRTSVIIPPGPGGAVVRQPAPVPVLEVVDVVAAAGRPSPDGRAGVVGRRVEEHVARLAGPDVQRVGPVRRVDACRCAAARRPGRRRASGCPAAASRAAGSRGWPAAAAPARPGSPGSSAEFGWL